MNFKASQSKRALLSPHLEALVEGAGFQGTPCWLIRESGSVAPPIPPRWKARPMRNEKAAKLVERSKREKAPLGYVSGGVPFDSDGTPARRLFDSLDHQWPFLVNAHFVAHVERCHPAGTWEIAADGRLLYWRWIARRWQLVGLVALIRPTGTAWKRDEA